MGLNWRDASKSPRVRKETQGSQSLTLGYIPSPAPRASVSGPEGRRIVAPAEALRGRGSRHAPT